MSEQPKPEKTCAGCAHSYMMPSDQELVCGHPDSGSFGIYARIASRGRRRDGTVSPELAHCGEALQKFEEHPLRFPNGGLKPTINKEGLSFQTWLGMLYNGNVNGALPPDLEKTLRAVWWNGTNPHDYAREQRAKADGS